MCLLARSWEEERGGLLVSLANCASIIFVGVKFCTQFGPLSVTRCLIHMSPFPWPLINVSLSQFNHGTCMYSPKEPSVVFVDRKRKVGDLNYQNSVLCWYEVWYPRINVESYRLSPRR